MMGSLLKHNEIQDLWDPGSIQSYKDYLDFITDEFFSNDQQMFVYFL